MSELETLRATITALQREVAALRGSGTAHANDIDAALLEAGCSADVIGAARALFTSAAKQASDGTWGIDTLMKSSLPKVAQRFLDARPHLRGATVDPNDIANRAGYPKDAHGKPIPFQDLTTDQLFELSGDDPSAAPPELWNVDASDFGNAPIESLDADRVAAEKAVAPKSSKAVAEMSSDELFASAGAWPDEDDDE